MTVARRHRGARLTLLDLAQAHNFQRFLMCAEGPPGTHRFTLPLDLFVWSVPARAEDGYPNLGMLSWPGHEDHAPRPRPRNCGRCGLRYGETAHGPGFCIDRRRRQRFFHVTAQARHRDAAGTRGRGWAVDRPFDLPNFERWVTRHVGLLKPGDRMAVEIER